MVSFPRRDSNLNCQRKSNPLVDALRQQSRWMVFGSEVNPLQQYYPWRPFVLWYYTRQMDQSISAEVDARFQAHRAASMMEKSTSSARRGKSVIDLALTAYLTHKDRDDHSEVIDPLFKRMAINQIKLFLFLGHDTTSSTICYLLYLLSIHSRVLSRLRAELDDVLGGDPSQAAARISQDPYLLSQLPYTTAIIKESMRLFPVSAPTRTGEPSFTITDPRNGLRYPADQSMLLWLPIHACHHDPAFWPRVDEFLPERWLAKEGEELHVSRGAWRPFGDGPRMCPGKEMTMIELRIVLCLVARTFEIRAVYDELDAAVDGKGQRAKEGTPLRLVEGERAYQAGKGEPAGFLPCRVKKL